MNPQTRYASYLLRFQLAENNDHPTWVVTIQSTRTGERRQFPSLAGLILFLQDEFAADQRPPDSRPPNASG